MLRSHKRSALVPFIALIVLLPAAPVKFVGPEGEQNHSPAYAKAAPSTDTRIFPGAKHVDVTLHGAALVAEVSN